MARKSSNRPTDAELAILRILWDKGPSTVRQVHEVLNTGGDVGYTTVLKTMQIMAEKELLDRDESNRAHVYMPRKEKAETQGHLLADLRDRAFKGSTSSLVMQALSTQKASADDLAEIRALLDRLEGEE